MYISAALLVILYVYIGFSEAAPRISPYDASPISRKPDSASDTWETIHTDMPRTLPESSFALGPLTGLTPSPAIVSAGPITSASPNSETATTFQPPTTDPTTTTTTTTAAQHVSKPHLPLTVAFSCILCITGGIMKQISHLMASLLLYAPVTCFNQRKKTEAFHVCICTIMLSWH